MRAKDSFLKSAERENWERLASSKTFEVACDAALLDLLLEQPEHGTPEKGWDAHSRMMGAKRLIEILSKLHLKDVPPEPMKMRNLPPPK